MANQIDLVTFEQSKGIKIVHINVRSLFNKIQEVSMCYNYCDVIIVTETWLNASIPDSAVYIPDFVLIRQDRYITDTMKGGGICIYIKEKYSITKLDQMSCVTSDYEILGVKVKMGNIKPFFIIGTYRPPKGKPLNMFTFLEELIGETDLLRNELYIIGDMNINYNSIQNLRKLKIKNFESRFGLRQLINIPTRITETTSTVLDWIFSNSAHTASFGTLNHNISDHLPIFLVRKKIRTKCLKKKVMGRSYLRYDSEQFQNMFSEADWAEFDEVGIEFVDPNMLWSIFENNMLNALNQLCPIRQLTVPITKPKWMNDEIVLLMRNRDKMYKKARRTKDPIVWRKARFLRNRVESHIKNYKKNKIQSELNLNKNNPIKFWKNIREIWPEDHTPNVMILRDEFDPQRTFEDMDLAEHINEYFTNIGNKLADVITNRIDGNQQHSYEQLVLNNFNDTISNIPISRDELKHALKLVDISKSSAIENIRSKVIVDAYMVQLDRMLKVYNGSLTRCIYPMGWKRSTVIPLSKINVPKSASDMRPISLLPLPGKIMERIISNRLKQYLQDHDILTEKQHGFRKKRSTLSAIVEFLHNIYNNLSAGFDSNIIYLDLKKAFDTVHHKMLLHKLKLIGLDEKSVKWFDSYLQDREQQTKMNGFVSSSKTVKYGVPQGSILGPTLFSIYINDLAELVNCSLIFYADDTVLLDKNPTILQENLNIVDNWCKKNLLTINCKKSHWMKSQFLIKNDENVDIQYKLGDTVLTNVTEYRYLGLLVDSQLNFHAHREHVVNRVNYKLLFFRR